MKFLPFGFLAVLGTGLFLGDTARAQWSHRVDVNLLATSFNTGAGAPTVAADGAGGVFAAWDDTRTSLTNKSDIYIQRFDSSGIAKWTPDGVAVVTLPGEQTDPLVVAGSGGAVFVIWEDHRLSPAGGTANPRIYAQYFNANGEAQWAANGIRVGTNDLDQTELAVAGDGNGNLLVSWLEIASPRTSYVQKVDPAGNLLWGSGGLPYSSGGTFGATELNVVADGAGGAVVGWIQVGATNPRIWAQRILANGTAAYSAVVFGGDTNAISSVLPNRFLPMVSDGAGGAIIGWTSSDPTNNFNQYVQRVDGSGNLPWGTASVQLVDQPGVQDNLQLVSDGANGAFCFWDDQRTGADNVYGQRVNGAGSIVFAANGIPAGTTVTTRFDAKAVADGAGGAIVSFRKGSDGIFAQRLDATGSRMWGTDGVQLTTLGALNFPNLTSDGANGAILGILAQVGGNRPGLKKVLANGSLPTSRLVNISTRAFVGTGNAQAIPGFVISGSGSKTVLIRAVGPKLTDFGVSNVLADPQLTLVNSNTQAFIAGNDNWVPAEVNAITAQVGAFALNPGSKDAALVATPATGSFTAQVTGVGSTEGVALAEVYDADGANSPASLANLSSRVFVKTGDEVAIAGFVVNGPATITLLIRAVGPTLGQPPFNLGNVLANPSLTLFDGANAEIASNDNWSSSGSEATAIALAAQQVGAFALNVGSLDSAMLVTVKPGSYTARALGVNGLTGICLIELYVVPFTN